MYKPKIFLVGNEKEKLIALEETDYLTEDILQELLERYPDLLPGDQIDPENPRRWLLVAREMGVPGDVDETGRWSLDHLFLDQDGIPTFVECKRSSDTRTRREVVAQMLDYAANGTEYWTMERIRQSATETAQNQGRDLDEEVAELFGLDRSENDLEQYWKLVETNLLNNKVRLMFITDRTPKELRRLIEFLNKEMTHVEVLGIEIKQYQKDDQSGQKALVSRVVGFTESARSAKESLVKRTQHLNRQEYLGACSPEAQEFFQRILEKAEQNGLTIYWGTVGFSVRVFSSKVNRLATFIMGFPPNKFQLYIHPDWIYDEKAPELKEELRKYQIFEEGGSYTWKANVTKENLAQMNEIIDFILAQVNEHIRANQ